MVRKVYIKPEVATEKIEPGALAIEGSPVPFEVVTLVACVILECT